MSHPVRSTPFSATAADRRGSEKYAKVEDLTNDTGQVVGKAYYRADDSGRLSLHKTKYAVDQTSGLLGSSTTELTKYANGDTKLKNRTEAAGLLGGSSYQSSVKHKADGSVEAKQTESHHFVGTTWASAVSHARIGSGGQLLDVMQAQQLGGSAWSWGWAADRNDSRSAAYQRQSRAFTCGSPPYKAPDAGVAPPQPAAATAAPDPTAAPQEPAPAAPPDAQARPRKSSGPQGPSSAPVTSSAEDRSPPDDKAFEAQLDVIRGATAGARDKARAASNAVDPQLLQSRYGGLLSGDLPPDQRRLLALSFLGLDAKAYPDVIKRTLHGFKLAHPDVGGSAELFKYVVAARDIVMA